MSLLKEIKFLFIFVTSKVKKDGASHIEGSSLCLCSSFIAAPFVPHPLWIPTMAKHKAQFFQSDGPGHWLPKWFQKSLVPQASFFLPFLISAIIHPSREIPVIPSLPSVYSPLRPSGILSLKILRVRPLSRGEGFLLFGGGYNPCDSC